MNKTINGFILIDAPWSALNNAGKDAGERTDNAVKVKTIKRGRDVFPYVSGQSIRYWWRETLMKKFDWKLSPVERVKKVAYTSADPIEYDDDDMFGYMRATKEEIEENGKKKKGKDITVTRISPIKNSPLLSIYSQSPTNDFGVMARQKEGDPVPYEHEFYSTIFKGIFSIDIDMSGVFYETHKTGYNNLLKEIKEKAKNLNLEYDEENKSWKMPVEIRQKRIKDVILALPYLSGGANLTTHLTDVSPKFIILAVIEGGNNIFMNIVDEDGVNFEALTQIIEEYKDIILSDIYIGKREGFLDEINEKLSEFSEKEWGNNSKKISIKNDSINNTVIEFTKILDKFIT